MPTILIVLICSGAAAACAALAVVPLALREQVPKRWIGWSNALAAGVMLGGAYVLTVSDALIAGGASPDGQPAPWTGASGALLGILFIRWTHKALRTSELDLNRLEQVDAVYGYRVLLVGALHSASEGVAIGVAMVVDLKLGVLMAVAIALHNIPEALVLGAVLRRLRLRLGEVAAIAVGANSSQVLLSLVAFALVEAAPATLPFVLGFAAGALLKLVLVELLPEAYREAGHTSIAVVSSLAMSLVVLFQGFFVG